MEGEKEQFSGWPDGSTPLETAHKRIAELEAKIREWEAWFDALERFEGNEPPKRLE